MTIILDLNTDRLFAEPFRLDSAPVDSIRELLRFESVPMDTVMVISAQQRRHSAPNAVRSAYPNRARQNATALDDDLITWEDTEWQ